MSMATEYLIGKDSRCSIINVPALSVCVVEGVVCDASLAVNVVAVSSGTKILPIKLYNYTVWL